MKICEKCNTQTKNDSAEFCTVCGEAFDNSQIQSTVENNAVSVNTPETNKKGKRFLSITLGVICCVFLVCILFNFSANLSLSIVSFKFDSEFFENALTASGSFLKQILYQQSDLTQLADSAAALIDFVLASVSGFSGEICGILRYEFAVRTVFSLINCVLTFLVAFVLFGGNRKNLKAPSVMLIISGIAALFLGGVFVVLSVMMQEYFYYVDSVSQVLGLSFVLSGVLEILLGSVFCTLSSHKKYKND